MKIIHTADLHFDSKLETNLDALKAKDRKKELLATFERMVEYAKANGVSTIIIAGDMFDKSRISTKTKEFVLNCIALNPSIDFLYVSGNHDEDIFIESIETLPKNLYIFDERWKTINYKECDITGINYNDSSEKYLYDTLFLNKEKINIVIMHGPLGSRGSGINVNNLKGKGISYLALGHIHKFQKGSIDNDGYFVYPGCPEGRGFDEIGPKGFVLINIENNKLDSEFIPFAKRELHEVVIDITGIDSWIDVRKNVSLKTNSIPDKDMVKVRLIGNYDINLVKQIELLNEYLNEHYFFAKVVDESKIAINAKDYENDISLKGEFIRNVLQSNDLTPDEKNEIIEYGIKALMKEEI
ncbi:MAG: DNA repair exonuclease [Acholeplasmatales bacterium]|nr:DNA repair exonuclease [Acholeplasmatales bacterium]